MQFKNSPDKYGAVSKAFHWLTSITVLCLLGIGLYMVRADKSASARATAVSSALAGSKLPGTAA